MLTAPVVDPPAERGLISNAGALLASRMVRAGLGWGGTVLIVRSLSVDEFGRFTLIFTVLGLMSVVTDLGTGRVAVRGMLDDTGRDPGAFAGTYVVLRTMLGGVGYVLALLVVVALGSPAEVVAATSVAGIVVVLATPSRALDVVFQARLRLGTVGTAESVGTLAQLALVAAIAVAGGSLLLFTVPFVLGELVVLLWKARAAHRAVRLRLHVDLALWRELLREALPLSAGLGLAVVYYRVDALLLAEISGYEAVGLYGVSYKFIDVMHFASTAVTVPLLTLLVRSWPHDMVGFGHHLRRGAMLLGLLGGWALTGLVGFAEPLSALFYGSHYAQGAQATRVLAVAELVGFFVALVLVCLIAAGRHRHYAWVMLAGLALNVGLNLVVIPRAGYVGASVVTLVTNVIVLVLLGGLLVGLPGRGSWRLSKLAAVPLAVLAGLLAGRLADDVLPWPVAAACGAVTYGAAAAALGLTAAAGLGPGWTRRSTADQTADKGPA